MRFQLAVLKGRRVVIREAAKEKRIVNGYIPLVMCTVAAKDSNQRRTCEWSKIMALQ